MIRANKHSALNYWLNSLLAEVEFEKSRIPFFWPRVMYDFIDIVGA